MCSHKNSTPKATVVPADYHFLTPIIRRATRGKLCPLSFIGAETANDENYKEARDPLFYSLFVYMIIE